MKSIDDRAQGSRTLESTSDIPERLAALVRLLSYARDEANDVDADVLAYCLNVALAAVVDNLQERASGQSIVADMQDEVETLRRH